MSAHAKNENPVPPSDTKNNNYVKTDHRDRSRTCAVLFYKHHYEEIRDNCVFTITTTTTAIIIIIIIILVTCFRIYQT